MRRPVWILASASPRRKEILGQLGMQFRIDPSHLTEPERSPFETPQAYAIRVARLKTKEVAGKYHSGWVLGADTIVVLGKSILMKPKTPAEARHMIGKLSGRWHEVITGICLWDCDRRRSRSAFCRTRVHFRRLSSAEVDWYIKTGEYRDKAGAYGIQGYASLFADRIEGCYFNIVGFPIALFEKLCRKLRIDLTRHLKIRRARSISNPESRISN